MAFRSSRVVIYSWKCKDATNPPGNCYGSTTILRKIDREARFIRNLPASNFTVISYFPKAAQRDSDTISVGSLSGIISRLLFKIPSRTSGNNSISSDEG